MIKDRFSPPVRDIPHGWRTLAPGAGMTKVSEECRQ